MSRMVGASGGSGARFGTGFTGGINTFWSCNKAGAIPHFTEHINSNPRHFDSWMFRGISHSIIGEHDKAVHDLQTAASVGSPCEKLVADAKLLELQGKASQCLSTYKDAIQKYPSDGIGWFWTAMTLSECQERSELFKRAIGLNYMPYECHYQLGSQCLGNDNPLEDTQSQYNDKCTKAIPDFNACLQGNPYRTVCHIELGFAHLQLNHVQEAKQCFEKAVDLNPVLTDSNAGLALIYEHEGNHLKAKLNWEIYRNSVEPREQRVGSGGSGSGGSGSGGSGNDGSGIGPLFDQMSLADKDDSLKIPNEEIARVYVARRALGGLKSLLLKYRLLAHSAVILETRIGNYYILEYMGDSTVYLKKIELNVVHTQEKGKPHQVIMVDGVPWTKQLHGKAVSAGWTLEKVNSG